MLQARRALAQKVADHLFEAETAVDLALSRTAGLAQVMPDVRTDAGLSALIGQGAVERACEAMAALATARRALCETHNELTVARTQIGLGAIAFGATDKPPVTSPGSEPKRLRAVGDDG